MQSQGKHRAAQRTSKIANSRVVKTAAKAAGPEGQAISAGVKRAAKASAKKSQKAARKSKASYFQGATIASSGRGPQATNIKGDRRLLVAEFVLCIVIVFLEPVAANKSGKSTDFSKVMKQLLSVGAVFMVLGLISSGGTRLSRTAVALGGLITLTLLVGKQDELVYLSQALAGTNTTTDTSNTPPSGNATVSA